MKFKVAAKQMTVINIETKVIQATFVLIIHFTTGYPGLTHF